SAKVLVVAAAIVPALFLNSFLAYLLFAPLMVVLCGRWSRGAEGRPGWPQLSAGRWLGLLAALDVLYLLLYYTAGTIIFPYVQSFYEGLTMPSTAVVVLLQLLVRGPVFIAGGLLMVRMTPASRLELALLFAAVMSIIGGAAQLIIPTPFFPDAVRYVHFMEVVPSNFLFGFLTGWLLGGRREGRSAHAVAAPA
ncbi:MAG TPA: hypothetical protein VNK41_01520, partial [Vicinamibacterales bacterium]|nr:hypothetical protein [Vicinamibacterales bacterium]